MSSIRVNSGTLTFTPIPSKKHYALVTFPNDTKHPGKKYVFGFDAFVGMHPMEAWYKLLDEYDIAVQTREGGPMDAQLKDIVTACCAFNEEEPELTPDQAMVEAYGAVLPIKPILGVAYHSKKNFAKIPLSKIIVSACFWENPPAPAKIAAHYESFIAAAKERKKITDPVLPGALKVKKVGGVYYLTDGFCTYLLYRAFGYDTATVKVVDGVAKKDQ